MEKSHEVGLDQVDRGVAERFQGLGIRIALDAGVDLIVGERLDQPALGIEHGEQTRWTVGHRHEIGERQRADHLGDVIEKVVPSQSDRRFDVAEQLDKGERTRRSADADDEPSIVEACRRDRAETTRQPECDHDRIGDQSECDR